MGRPKKKEYDAETVLKELVETVVELYDDYSQIKAVANELNLAEHKVKKLLITGKAVSYPQTEEIQELMKSGKTAAEVCVILGLSRASVRLRRRVRFILQKENISSKVRSRSITTRPIQAPHQQVTITPKFSNELMSS